MATIVPSGAKANPNFRVSLNGNIVDGRGMAGGYSAWQLFPTGTKVAPVRTKSSTPYTASNATSLYMFGQDGAFDQYIPQSAEDFQVGEDIIMNGPVSQPGTSYKYIIMTGTTSGYVVRWQYTDGQS